MTCERAIFFILLLHSALAGAPLRVADADEARPLADAAADTVINAEGSTYDSHPSAVTASDGATWMAWHAYESGRDRVKLRRVSASGQLGLLHVVSEQGTVHGPPTVVLIDEESVWVVWSAKIASRWQILARNLHGGDWRPTVPVSDATSDAILPAASRVADGQMIVAWSDVREGLIRIRSRLLRDEEWEPMQTVSSADHEAFRPTFAVDHAGTVWAFWDRYDGTRYGVAGRRLLPDRGPIERVSPEGHHCLTPTALASAQGLCVAWLRKVDVIGGPGVVSQWHTLHAAIREDGRWTVITDDQGDSVAAELTQGLVAKIDPQAIATGGYLGRRTAPLLLNNGTDVWLLWERKADHRGSTPDVVGDLLGRPLRDDVWDDPVLLHTGRLDYHLVHPARAAAGRFSLLASQLPRRERRIYHRVVADLKSARPFEQEKWAGWQPVELPVESELTEHREIRIGEQSYQLYWADMHCHSGLTADAEGEQDELTHYARNCAQLDVVVFTNNDFLYDVPLTEYEYSLGNFFAGVYSRPGEFLSLPGYEWTSRVPGVPGASDADPGNWTKPYQNRSHQNHRTVVYPPGGGPVIRYPEVANDISVLNDAVQRAGGITLTQHDAFRPSGHPVEVGMELTSGWRNYIARVPELFHEPLNRGARLGFVANGDSHRRAPGLSGALTGIYAEELTAESILDALRQRRCFATNGSRMFLDARANGAFMGQDVVSENRTVNLSLRAIGTRPIVSASLIRDGQELERFPGNGSRELDVAFQDNGLASGTHWYYWRISQERDAPVLPGNLMVAHGHLAWSTPHWVVTP